jgi:UDP-GlcNAc:undecaprenyl-phosphate/decaprenyl-phosphate GlcNAc-1-phosphate transferase
MPVAIGLLLGAVLGWAAWVALRPVWESEVLQRENFRGTRIPVAGGLALVVAVTAATAVISFWEVLRGAGPPDRPTVAVVLAAAGFGLLGLIDDVLGGRGVRGFAGHLREAARGRLTTGGLKLFGGGLVAVAVAATTIPGSALQLAVDALVIALAANLFNLFDLAPGRAVKVAVLTFLAIVLVAGSGEVLRPAAVMIGAAVALLVPDLRERVMLGDTGANALGSVIGLALVVTLTSRGRLVAAGILLILNLISERVSFSRVIDAAPPLRAFDRLGRRP